MNSSLGLNYFCRASPDEALQVCVSALLGIGRKDLPTLSLADSEDVLSNAGASERVSDLGGDCDGFLVLGHRELRQPPSPP
jgi:hypothetical protein